LRRVAILAAFALASRTAYAIEFGQSGPVVDVTSTTKPAWHGDNGDHTLCNDDYASLFEWFNAIGSYGPFSAWLRLDGAYFFSTAPLDLPSNDPTDTSPRCLSADYQNRFAQGFVPEKLNLRYAGDHADVTAGDSYLQFGRGLALSIRKVDELGVDTTLRGANTILRLGPVEATLVGGVTNNTNTDEATGLHADDFNDLVAGGHVDVGLFDRLRLGGHGVMVRFRDPWILVGPTIEAPRLFSNLGVFLEGVHQRRQSTTGGTETGNGFYGAVTAYKGPATVLLEGKVYGDLAVVQPPQSAIENQEFKTVRYAVPPTSERLFQPLEDPQNNIHGGRAKLDWRFNSSITAFANYGLFEQKSNQGAIEFPGTIHDPYTGADVRWNDGRSQGTLTAGSRYVFDDGTSRSDIHAEAEVTQVLPRAFSLKGKVSNRERYQRLTRRDWREGTLQLEAKWKSVLGVAAIVDYTTDPTQPDTWYPGGAIHWMPANWATFDLFAGARAGGLKCVSGVCRVFPAFEGAELTATIRF